jgi:hypothetical protein
MSRRNPKECGPQKKRVKHGPAGGTSKRDPPIGAAHPAAAPQGIFDRKGVCPVSVKMSLGDRSALPTGALTDHIPLRCAPAVETASGMKRPPPASLGP